MKPTANASCSPHPARPGRAYQRSPSLKSLLKKYSSPAIEKKAQEIAAEAKLFDVLPEHGLRRPDWAWLLGAHLVAGKEVEKRRTEAPGVLDAAKTLLAVMQQDYDENMLERMRLNPAYVNAHQFWQNPGARFELQARVLAGQTESEIAALFGTSASTIMAAERLFFDVRSRLESASFVTHSVIGLHDGPTSSEQTERAIMLNLAYYGGPKAVDLMIYGTLNGRNQKPLAADLTRRLVNDNRDLLMIKSAIALRKIDLSDPKTQKWLFKQLFDEPKGPKQNAKQRAEDALMKKCLDEGVEVFQKSPPWRPYSPVSGAHRSA